MKNNKKKTLLFLSAVMLVFLVFMISSNNQSDVKHSNYETDYNYIQNEDGPKSPSVSGIFIMNWSKAPDVTPGGDGSRGNPYVIEDKTFFSDYNDGGSNFGILVRNTTKHFIIQNCSFFSSATYRTAGSAGIKLDNVTNGKIIDCDFNTGDPINDRNYYGISLTESNNITIYNNDVSNCDTIGIYLDLSYNNNITSNYVRNSYRNASLEVYQDYGIYISRSHNNTITNNTINDNNVYGVVMQDNSHDNIVSNNNASNSWVEKYQERGISTITSDDCTIFNNSLIDNLNYGLFIQNSQNTNVTENQASSSSAIAGVYLLNFNNGIVSNNSANDNDQYGFYMENCNANLIFNNSAMDNVQYGISITNCDSNNVFSENTMIGSGIGFGDLEGTIEEMSFTIDTTNLINGKKVYHYVNKTDLKVSNFTSAGQIFLINCSDSIMSNLNVSYSSMGISLFYCDNITIFNVTSNNNNHGIYLHESSNNNITKSSTNTNSNYGIRLNGNCENNTIENNTLNNNGYHGIFLSYYCNFNNITGNIIKNNAQAAVFSGIHVYDSCDDNIIMNNFVGNDATAQDYGISINTNSQNNQIDNNTVYNNRMYGIYINGNCNNTIIIENTVNNNNDHGIYVSSSEDVSIKNNTITNNGVATTDHGINIALNSYRVIISDNILSGNTGHGIYLINTCDDAKIFNNYITTSKPQKGIFLYGCTNAIISGNTMIGGDLYLMSATSAPSHFTHTIYTNNTVNGEAIYYYNSETNLDPNDFTKDGSPAQIILINCVNSIVSSVNLSYVTIGIFMFGCNNIEIFNCTINNNLMYGIYLQRNSDSNRIIQNIINENERHGIYSNGISGSCDLNIIYNNTINNNIQHGIYLLYSHNFNNISKNQITNNRYGVYLNGVSDIYHCENNTISENEINNNRWDGIKLYLFCFSNNLTGNNIMDNGFSSDYSGIVLENTCNNNTIYNNTIYNSLTTSQDNGIQLKTSCSSNEISENKICNNINYGILFSSSGLNRIFNNTITNEGGNQDYGIFFTKNSDYNNITSNTISDQNNYGIRLESSSYNRIFFNILTNNSGYVNATSEDGACVENLKAMNIIDGTLAHFAIDEKGIDGLTWTYTISIGWFSGSGIWADPYIIEDWTLDCYDYDIMSGIVIKNSDSYFIIRNCSILRAGGLVKDAGIKLINTNHALITNNSIYNNNRIGIYLENCNNITISNNSIYGNSYYGIQIDGSLTNPCENNTILLNTIKDNPYIGIYFNTYCNDNYILNNTIKNNGQISGTYGGIYLSTNCNNNNISYNTLMDNEERGISFDSNCNFNTILGNNISGSDDYGIYFNNNDNNNIILNTIYGNGEGIRLENNCFNNNISQNNIFAHTSTGIILDSCNDITISKNTINNNNGHGIYIYGAIDNPGDFNIIDNNTITNNQYNGIYLWNYCSNNNITSNIIKDNGNAGDYSGINVSYICNDNIIDRNTISSVATSDQDFGIRFDSSSGACTGNTISRNKIENNEDYGVYFASNCDDNNISDNIITNSNSYGIYLGTSCNNNNVLNNTLSQNSGMYTFDVTPRNIFNMNTINGFLSSILIDESGAIGLTWVEALSYGWVTGTGIESDPYLIENLIINGTNVYSISPIEIRNSPNAHFKIKNCIIVDSGELMTTLDVGIKLYYVNNGTITNVTCANNIYGIYLYNSNLNLIDNSTIKNNGLSVAGTYYGIQLNNNCDDNEILNNRIYNDFGTDQDRGISLNTGCDNNLISENDIFDNVVFGVYIYSSCLGNNITYNSFEGNQIMGLFINNTCDNTLISDNSVSGSTVAGIYLYNSDSCTISSNNVTENSGYGLYIDAFCINNIIEKNNISNNDDAGIFIYSNSNSNTIIENIINDNVYGIQFFNSLITNTKVYNNTLNGNSNSAIYKDTSTIGNYFSINIINGILSSILIDASGTIGFNWADALNSGWVTGSGILGNPYLFKDLTINGRNITYLSCIEINNSNSYFRIENCNLTNSGSTSSDAGIKLINVNNGTITKCNVSANNYHGIYLYGECDYNNITLNNVNDNLRHGIYLYGLSSAVHCDFNEISNNTVLNNQYDGVRLENDGRNNTITGNKIRNNGESGSVGVYLLNDCDNNDILSNTITNDVGIWFQQYGVYLYNDCDYNKIAYNTINRHNIDGVRLIMYCNNNLVINNILIGNRKNGTYVGEFCYDNIISMNTINDAIDRVLIDGLGIAGLTWPEAFLEYWCTGAGTKLNPYVISNIKIDGNNTGSGIYINNSYVYFIIDNCEVFNAGSKPGITGDDAGIRLYNVTNGLLIGNNISNNGHTGISLFSCEKINITDNNVNNNAERGICLYYTNNSYISINHVNYTQNHEGIVIWKWSHNITITENVACHNNQDGIIVLDFCYDINVSKNTACFNLEGGIEIWNNCYDINISGNIIYNNTLDGIYVNLNCYDIIIVENTINNNYQSGIYIYNGCNQILIVNNSITENKRHGVYLNDICIENIILTNNISKNGRNGIRFYDNCDNNTVSKNNVTRNGYGSVNFEDQSGIYLQIDNDYNNFTYNIISFNNLGGISTQNHTSTQASNNNLLIFGNLIYNNTFGILFNTEISLAVITENNIYDNNCGILFCTVLNSIITNNNITSNGYGIQLNSSSYNNIIFKNFLNNNSICAVFMTQNSDFNNVTTNLIINNIMGVYIEDTTMNNNCIYNNTFITNKIHALDMSFNTFNFWNNSKIGNFWDNYTGRDAQRDGIGDTPWIIQGFANAEDRLPIWGFGPKITIITPITGDTYITYTDAEDIPVYNVDISQYYPKTVWYRPWKLNAQWFTLAGASFPITSSGIIDEDFWGKLEAGDYILEFFASDTYGIVYSESVIITKEIIDEKEPELIEEIITYLTSPEGAATVGGSAAAAGGISIGVFLANNWTQIAASRAQKSARKAILKKASKKSLKRFLKKYSRKILRRLINKRLYAQYLE